MSEDREIGSYRILRVLGRGGMGAVYLGEHTLLGRKAAIKELLPALSADEAVVQRFFNEAKAVTQIADPGIVQVFDFGYDDNGSAYIVMELLEGETLAERLQRLGRIGVVDTLRLMRLVCLSLAAAHAKGIVHRDLKPENIFVVADPAVAGGERAKILDFGIAKLTRTEGNAMTQTGAMMGTPLYMSPEQCRGAGALDHRADIYSIACVMLTMLTGRPPFEAEGAGDLIVAHLQQSPPLAASRIAGIPPVIDDILQRALAKEPHQRFQSMTELAKALGTVEEEITVGRLTPLPGSLPFVMPTQPTGMGGVAPAIPASPTTLTGAAGDRPTIPPRSNRTAIAAIAGALVVAGVIAVMVTRQHGSTRPATGSVTQPADAMSVPVAAPPTDAAIEMRADAAVLISVDAAVDAAVKATPKPTHHEGKHVPTTGSASDVDRSD